MSDPSHKQILAVRLASAASAAWAFFQAEVNELENSKEVAEVYMGALAFLVGYVLHANESLAKKEFTPEVFEEIMLAFSKDVLAGLERIRERERNLAGSPSESEPVGVH